MTMRPSLAWELELMEDCLRAIPAFIARHRPDDLSKHKMTVPEALGTLTLICRGSRTKTIDSHSPGPESPRSARQQSP